jgi:ferritin-like metal-binding protein YciE
LRAGFEKHLEQTKGHAQRLEQVFTALGEKPSGKRCKGMEGLIEEGKEMMEEDLEDAALDAGLISAAQRVEHYEIAAYRCARTYAKIRGEEEKETDEKLTELAENINVEAAGSGSKNEEEGQKRTPSRRGKPKSVRAKSESNALRSGRSFHSVKTKVKDL